MNQQLFILSLLVGLSYFSLSNAQINSKKINDKSMFLLKKEIVKTSTITSTIENLTRKDSPQAMARTKFLSQTPSILYTAVLRGKVALPCDVTAPTSDDSVALILWYKDDALAPIYTLDARKGNLEQARTITAASLEGRAYFNLHNRPAFLQIDPIRLEDAGDYRCRVDFKKARTVNTVISLKVIVPPETPQISSLDGKVLKELVGPFNEGDSLQLTCTTNGGKPKPSLTWWRDYTLLDDSFEYNNKDVTSNQITINSLSRHHLLSIFTCQAINNNITVPSSTSITLDLNLKPTEVHIKQLTPILVSEKEAKFECTTSGSRPRANLYWLFEGKRLNTPLTGDHQTSTTITLKVKQIHNGVSLICVAENPKIANSSISDELILDVQFSPILNLQLGTSTLSLQTLQEGNDIYFDCHIKANPRFNQALIWRFNDQILKPAPGVIQSNQSLVLQKVNRKQSGIYKCEVTNNQGTTLSNAISLNIRYAPVCRNSFIYVYGVSTFETVHLQCDVDANPPNVMFNWKLKSNSFSENLHQINDTSAVLKYNPQTPQDFGTIQCIAKNDVGIQQTPCFFQIITAGLPVFPYDCSLSNQSDTSLIISCEHTSLNNNNNIDQTMFQLNEDVNLNGDLTSFSDNENNVIANNSIHNNEIELNKKHLNKQNNLNVKNINKNSVIKINNKTPSSIFIYPNLIYFCEVYKGNHLVRNVSTSLFEHNVTNKNYTGLNNLNSNFEFLVNNLQSATQYQIKIYAKNSKGASRHIMLKAETLRPAERLVDSFTNLDSIFASDSINSNEGYGQLSSGSNTDDNALTSDGTNLDLSDTNSNILNSESLSSRNTRSMFGLNSGKPMLLVLLSGIILVSLIIVALGVAVILRVKRVQGRCSSNLTGSNGSSIAKTSNSNSHLMNEASTGTVNTSCSTGDLLTAKNQIHSSKSQNSSPAHHQFQLNTTLLHNSAINQNATLGRHPQNPNNPLISNNQLFKRHSITNSSLLVHSSPQKILQTNNSSFIPNPSANNGIITTALPGITDDCCCEEDYCEELRMASSVITEQQQQRALLAQHHLDQHQLYQSYLNSGKSPDIIPSYGNIIPNYENTNKQYIAYDYPANVLQAANNLNTINNLTKLNLISDSNLQYAELQFQPQINQYITEQQNVLINSNYEQLNDESGFEEYNNGSIIDGDRSLNEHYSFKNTINKDLLSQQLQIKKNKNLIQIQNSDLIGSSSQLEYAKLDFCNELLKNNQVLNSNVTSNSQNLINTKISRVNVVSNTPDNLSSNEQANSNKFESTV